MMRHALIFSSVFSRELTDLKVASEGSEATKHRVTFRDFIAPSALKPFLICLTLMFFFQFSGINVILQVGRKNIFPSICRNMIILFLVHRHDLFYRRELH